MNNLAEKLESIIFVSGCSIDRRDIFAKLDVTKKELETAVSVLKLKYSGSSGIQLLDFNNKLQFSSASAYAEDVSLVLNPIRERQLTKATLETVAIIAYKQPVTRLEIEEVRGVSCDYAINLLLEHKMIEMVGRKDTVGKPVLFGTTDEFLKRFNISSTSELPSYDDILASVKVIHEKKDDNLYNKFEISSDKIINTNNSIIKDENNSNDGTDDFV
ncbi:MAG: SMC-Scp complex subunit ScpB [Clostridia bacterium]